jgi:hypothetical protein
MQALKMNMIEKMMNQNRPAYASGLTAVEFEMIEKKIV